MMKIKIKWSELDKFKPIVVNLKNVKQWPIKKYGFDEYVYCDAAFLLNEKERRFTLVMPLQKLLREILLLPLNEQREMLTDNDCQYELTKLHNGLIKLKKIR